MLAIACAGYAWMPHSAASGTPDVHCTIAIASVTHPRMHDMALQPTTPTHASRLCTPPPDACWLSRLHHLMHLGCAAPTITCTWAVQSRPLRAPQLCSPLVGMGCMKAKPCLCAWNSTTGISARVRVSAGQPPLHPSSQHPKNTGVQTILAPSICVFRGVQGECPVADVCCVCVSVFVTLPV